MKPLRNRPLAWRIIIALLALGYVISASAQNRNANPAGAPPSQSATEGQIKPPDASNKNAASAQSAGDAARDQGDKGVKGSADANKNDATVNPASQGIVTGASNAAKPAPPKPDPSKSDQNQSSSSDQIALGERLRVTVSDRKALVSSPEDVSKLVLLLNSYPMKGVPAYLGTAEDELIFDLVPPDSARSNLSDDEKKRMNETWNALLGGTGGFPPSPRDVTVSVLGKDGVPLNSKSKIELRVVNPGRFWVFVVLLAFAIALFIYFARNSNLIRDPGPAPVDAAGAVALKSYSLSRTQLAFWSFIIIGAYAFIWLVTTNQNTLNSFTLGIFGISAATTAAATFMDKSKRTAAEANMTTLKQQGEAQAANNPAPPALAVGAAGAGAALANPNAEKIAALDAATRPQKSEGFWIDILSDDTGVTIHRFQNVVWTIVLGIIFIATVSKTLTMPNFDNTLLMLMGISSATFIALKPTEKPSGSSST